MAKVNRSLSEWVLEMSEDVYSSDAHLAIHHVCENYHTVSISRLASMGVYDLLFPFRLEISLPKDHTSTQP